MPHDSLRKKSAFNLGGLALSFLLANPAYAEAEHTTIGNAALIGDNNSHIELCLVIAMDMSGSVEQVEWQLQTHGLAQAFKHQAVEGAAESRDTLAVRDMVYGNGVNKAHEAWHLLSNRADTQRLSDYFASLEQKEFLEHQGSTTLENALQAAIELAATCPNPKADKIVYMIGDGMDDKAMYKPIAAWGENEIKQTSHKEEIHRLHQMAQANGVTINGSSFGDEHTDRYYQNYIISYHGHSFPTRGIQELGGIADYSDFENAIILQVVRDLSFIDPQVIDPALPPAFEKRNNAPEIKPA